MNPITIEHNLKIFLTLESHQKLMIDKDKKVYIDNRFYRDCRRTIDRISPFPNQYQSSRDSTYKIIELTYDSINWEFRQTHSILIKNSLINLSEKLSITYDTPLDLVKLETIRTNYETYLSFWL